MSAELNLLFTSNTLRAIDKEFGRFIQKYLTDKGDPVIGYAMLTSYELGRGHVCVDLAALDKNALFGLTQERAAEIATWLSLENKQQLTKSLVISKGDKATPLVFDGNRLYLYRYWQAEQFVAAQIRAKAVEVAVPSSTKALLNSLFERTDDEIDWQKVAAASALTYGFSVISGGPGTGKTTTVTKLLAALIKTAATPPIIKMVAPTGKAANRLTESISNAVSSLDVDDHTKALIPKQASTIHRLLGVVPNRVEFRHNQDNPLHLDVLVVDEASMVDLAMMAKLLAALPSKARIILLGDKDQLASVEAGAVLGNICTYAQAGFSAERANALCELTGFNLDGYIANSFAKNSIADGVSLLRKSYRFDENSGIGQLAYAINAGNKFKAEQVWQQNFADIARHHLDEQGLKAAVEVAAKGYRSYLEALANNESHKAILTKFNAFRLLCVLNQGEYGIIGLNKAIEDRLIKHKLISVGEQTFYIGRPVIVTSNDHGLGLYNGDIGIVVENQDGIRVVFEMADGTTKTFLPSRLPAHQTAYAMTVHKSQGSEFNHTLLLLPPDINPVMTKELVYTGVTRAKKRLDLFSTTLAFNRAIERKVERFSGLTDAISQ